MNRVRHQQDVLRGHAPPLRHDIPPITDRGHDAAHSNSRRFIAARRHVKAISRRYSYFVRIMKWLLPIMACAALIYVTLAPQLQRVEGFVLGDTSYVLENASNLAMMRPEYEGVDEQNQRYFVRAARAEEILGAPNQIALQYPEADITLKDQSWIALQSRNGVYRRDEERLGLVGDVSLFHDAGHEFRTESAEVALNTGEAQGDRPVRGQSPFGILTAAGFRIRQKADAIIFLGPARLTIFATAVRDEPAARPAEIATRPPDRNLAVRAPEPALGGIQP